MTRVFICTCPKYGLLFCPVRGLQFSAKVFVPAEILRFGLWQVLEKYFVLSKIMSILIIGEYFSFIRQQPQLDEFFSSSTLSCFVSLHNTKGYAGYYKETICSLKPIISGKI